MDKEERIYQRVLHSQVSNRHCFPRHKFCFVKSVHQLSGKEQIVQKPLCHAGPAAYTLMMNYTQVTLDNNMNN